MNSSYHTDDCDTVQATSYEICHLYSPFSVLLSTSCTLQETGEIIFYLMMLSDDLDDCCPILESDLCEIMVKYFDFSYDCPQAFSVLPQRIDTFWLVQFEKTNRYGEKIKLPRELSFYTKKYGKKRQIINHLLYLYEGNRNYVCFNNKKETVFQKITSWIRPKNSSDAEAGTRKKISFMKIGTKSISKSKAGQ